jgi:hypothetical protein
MHFGVESAEEKKTLLPSLWRQMSAAFRISAARGRTGRGAGQILSAVFICLQSVARLARCLRSVDPGYGIAAPPIQFK